MSYHGPQGPPSKNGRNKGVARADKARKRAEAEERAKHVKPERTRQYRRVTQAVEAQLNV